MPSNAIVDAARKFEHVRFRHQGRSTAGVDCAGLLVLVARELGAEPLDVCTYDHQPDPATLRAVLAAQPCLREIPPRLRAPGEVILMADRPGAPAHHLAIVTDRGIIHAYAPARRVVETTFRAELEPAIDRAYRWRY